jgi:fatty-acyl-CoA synthase
MSVAQLHSTTRLSVAAFLPRAAQVFPTRTAVVDGELTLTYAQFANRVAKLVTALTELGLSGGDRLAALCSNSHIMLELHHALPAHGAVLVPLNTRLSAGEIGLILDHSGAKVLVATREFYGLAAEATAGRNVTVLDAEDPSGPYETALRASGAADIGNLKPATGEQSLLAISYTSGTTGWPKGVMYSHRGAYLQALAMAYHARLAPETRYLWTLPMFHCNGWCFTWAVTAVGGTHVCLRSIDTGTIWNHLRGGAVTHLCAAPTVLTMLAEHPEAESLPQAVSVFTGGAAPTPAILRRTQGLGLDVTHLYGMTETYGPIAVNWWQPEWDALEDNAIAALRARQGIGNLVSEQPRVIRPDGTTVAADGREIGEVVVRGNTVMLGYYLDQAATDAAVVDGWLRTGDLAVVHPGGYLELRDRAKDCIISGGENISSVEVERVLDDHPDVIESAVVTRADTRWGEVPIAFVDRRRDSLTAAELVEFCRGRLARYKAPKDIVFGELPKNATGKIQKHVLRDLANSGAHTSVRSAE